jgi:hypothetical protein
MLRVLLLANITSCRLAFLMKLRSTMIAVFVKCDTCLSADGKYFQHLREYKLDIKCDTLNQIARTVAHN